MYDVLMIDPPWPQSKGGIRAVRPQQGRHLDYGTMSVNDIFALLDTEILALANHPHAVFMWTIDKFLCELEALMAERGYRRHARIVWDKENGVAPAFSVRFSHEYLIWYYDKFMPVDKAARGKYTTVLRAPGRQHSRKPDEAYAMVEAFYPAATKIDVFSRESRAGWAQFGNETDLFDKKNHTSS